MCPEGGREGELTEARELRDTGGGIGAICICNRLQAINKGKRIVIANKPISCEEGQPLELCHSGIKTCVKSLHEG